MTFRSVINRPQRRVAGAAFTLIELLTVIAILAILAGILVPMIQGVRHRAEVGRSMATIRELGTASLLYATDHNGKWPRSSHSSAPGESQWWVSLSGYLWSYSLTSKYDPRFQQFQETILRDPLDREEGSGQQGNLYSYGFNVYLQLDPLLDDYEGSPARWNRVSRVPAPERTVLFAANAQETADHFMAHFWANSEDAARDIDARDGANAAYVYCDGHVGWAPPAATYAPESGIDQWHPQKAAAQ